MRSVLITGANSYIGTSFEKYLAQWPQEYRVDTVDMLDGSWRQRSFAGYDAVYHVAGIAHSDAGKISEERKALYYKVNTELTIETARKAKADGVRQFIFMSSAIVYGDSAPIGKDKVITKDTPPRPANCYGDSKLQAELGLQELADSSFAVAILRPPMIYGPGCKGNFPTLDKLARKLSFFPKVANRRSMLYVGNLVEFVRLLVDDRAAGLFWPQNAEYSNTSQLVAMLAQAHGRTIRLVPGLTWLLRLASHCTAQVNKAFGNLCYDQALSTYQRPYRKYSLEESIKSL